MDSSNNTLNTKVEQVETNIISLTREEQNILNALRSKINISIDKKTSVIILNIIVQSASISANLADTLAIYMQGYIINYRTEKAR